MGHRHRFLVLDIPTFLADETLETKCINVDADENYFIPGKVCTNWLSFPAWLVDGGIFGDIMAEKGYIEFIESHDLTRKTRIWVVVQKQSREPLGEVRFWPAWRKYVFLPANNTLWDSYCLQIITAFLLGETNAWRAGLK